MGTPQRCDLVDLLDAVLEVEDPRVRPLINALGTAIAQDLDLGRTFGHEVGVRGSLRAAYWLARRDRAIREGAALFEGVSTFVDVYTAWKGNGRPDLGDPQSMALFAELDEAEAEGCPLPGSDKGLRLAAVRGRG